MTPLKLRLKGFTGIRSGLGRDEIELDLRALPDSARLVALAGPNGVGKSTLLDNLHPYRTMPSRASGDSVAGFSYYDHVCQPEALKELLWSLGGRLYRSEVLVRNGGRRKTEAYLYTEQDGRWVPVRLPDGTVSDGKTETYDACVEHLLGSAQAFFASQFTAQQRRALTDYRPGEFKALLSEMLGHDAIRAMGERASETTRLLKAGLAPLRAEQNAVLRQFEQLAEQRRALGDTEVALQRAEREREEARAAHDAALGRYTRLQHEYEHARRALPRRAELLRRIDQLAQSRQRHIELLQARCAQERERIAQIDAGVQTRRQQARQKQAELQQRLRQFESALASAERVRRAVRRLALRERVAALRTARCEAQAQQARAAEQMLGRLQQIESDIAAVEREAGQAALRVQDLQRRLGLTGAVPCAGTDLQDRCQLLSDAHAAQTLLPSAQGELARLAQRRQALRDEAQSMAGVHQAVQAARLALQRADARRARSEALAKQTAVAAAKSNEIEQARQMVAAVTAELRQLETQVLPGPTPEEAALRGAAEQALQRLLQELAAAQQLHGEEEASIRAELDTLPAAPDERALSDARGAAARAEKGLATAEQHYTECVRRRQRADDLGAQMRACKERIAALMARARHVEREIEGWGLLARGLGNDGVIALSIDEAGPALAALTNALLLGCYGPRFSVAIHTQSATAKGELREDFEIMVHDAESDQIKRLRHMSGGERIWIGEALTRAIALHLARNAGRSSETLFSDETDGALDPDRKRMFVAMKREVLRLGGYRREYFVSQTPELTHMADAVIDVAAL
jgi:exonuclease SbcC